MRSSADDSALCCAIVSASPGASGRRERLLSAFHKKEEAALGCVCNMCWSVSKVTHHRTGVVDAKKWACLLAWELTERPNWERATAPSFVHAYARNDARLDSACCSH